MKIMVTFHGRLNGAIGRFYTMTDILTFDVTPTKDDILTELYKTYEHIRIQHYKEMT